MEHVKNIPDNPFEPTEIPVESIAEPLPRPIVMTSRDREHGKDVLERAQALHTQVYLQKKYITSDELNRDGVFIDEYAERSVYLFARNGVRESACRYIEATKKEGILSLPTAKNFALDPDALRKTARTDMVSNIKASEVIEVSGLASIVREGSGPRGGSLDATRLLYAQVLRDSLDKGHKLWLLNTHEGLVRHLEILLGQEQVQRLGETKEYMGSPTVPAAINPFEVVRTALADTSEHGAMKQEYLKQTLQGVNDRYLTKELKYLLDEHGIRYEKTSPLKQLARNQKALAYGAVAGYTIARAVPVANIEEFEGNAGVFLAIDFATAFPYVWGLAEVATAKKPSRKLIGGAVAAGSFAAPYVYFWAEGDNYPAYVNGIVATIIGVSGLLAVRGLRKDARLNKQLRKDDDSDEPHNQ